MPFDLYSMIASWQGFGFFDIVLPFLLVFTLTFAVLQRTNILGGKNSIDVVVSLVVGFLFLQNTYLIVMLQNFLPNISFVLTLALGGLLVVGILKGGQIKSSTTTWAVVLAIIALCWALFTEAGSLNASDFLYNIFGPDALPIIAFILVIVGILFWVGRPSNSNTDTT